MGPHGIPDQKGNTWEYMVLFNCIARLATINSTFL